MCLPFCLQSPLHKKGGKTGNKKKMKSNQKINNQKKFTLEFLELNGLHPFASFMLLKFTTKPKLFF